MPGSFRGRAQRKRLGSGRRSWRPWGRSGSLSERSLETRRGSICFWTIQKWGSLLLLKAPDCFLADATAATRPLAAGWREAWPQAWELCAVPAPRQRAAWARVGRGTGGGKASCRGGSEAHPVLPTPVSTFPSAFPTSPGPSASSLFSAACGLRTGRLCAFQPQLTFPFPGRGVSAFTPLPVPLGWWPSTRPVALAAWSVSPAPLLGLTQWGRGQGALGGSVTRGSLGASRPMCRPEASETVAQTVGSRPPWLHSQWQSCDSQVALSWERTNQGHPPNLRHFPRPREGATHTAGAHSLERLGRPRGGRLRPHSTPGMLAELAAGRAQVRVGGRAWLPRAWCFSGKRTCLPSG